MERGTIFGLVGAAAIAGLIFWTRQAQADSVQPDVSSSPPLPQTPDIFMPPVDQNALITAVASGVAVGEGYAGRLPDGTVNNPPRASKGTRFNNPGDIFYQGQPVAYADLPSGWQALYNQLRRIFTGGSPAYPQFSTMFDFANTWTGADNPTGWYNAVAAKVSAAGFEIAPDMTLADFWAQRGAVAFSVCPPAPCACTGAVCG